MACSNQASRMGCGMWKPNMQAVQHFSGNVVYSEAVRIRILHMVQVPLLVCIYL